MASAQQWSEFSVDAQVNPSGWGPVGDADPMTPFDVPYAHYDKKERFARAADVNPSQHPQRVARFRRDEATGTNAEFTYTFDAAEDSSYQLVDMSKPRSKTTMRKPKLPRQQQQGQGGQQRPGQGRDGRDGRDPRDRVTTQPRNAAAAGQVPNRKHQKGGQRRGPFRRHRMDKLPSITVESSWEIVSEMDLPQLSKLSTAVPKPNQIQDLYWCGTLDQYNETFDRLTSRSSQRLQTFNRRTFYSVTTKDDPVIRERLLAPAAGNVYATDSIIAHLMAMARSNYSWDIQVQKVGRTIFLDKRDPPMEVLRDEEDKHDKKNYPFDFLTVSETAVEPPMINEDVERYNYPNALAVEATAINQNFSQQVLIGGEARRQQPNPNPFFVPEENDPEEEPASVAYRYRSFQLSDDITLVVRCELHSYSIKGGEEHYNTVYALNEWDSKYSGGVDWRQRYETQNSAILSTELKNNGFKIAKWTAQSILAGAEKMKLGFVSRHQPNDIIHHDILGTQTFRPRDFAAQIDMKEANMWAIVKTMIEQIQQQEDGEYVILKDPNRPQVRLYHVADDDGHGDKDEDEEDDDEDDEEH